MSNDIKSKRRYIKRREMRKKKRLVNMNYPPADMSMEEVARFWGEPTDDLAKFAEEVRKIEPKKGKRARPSIV